MELRNKKAYFDYSILEELEAGIALTGTEIKSIRKDTFVVIKKEEASVLNLYIAPYFEGNQFNHDERRSRKLLLHKREIRKLKEKVAMDGVTLIPLKMYFKKNHVKLLIGVCKGKKLYDKREVIKKKDMERERKSLI